MKKRLLYGLLLALCLCCLFAPAAAEGENLLLNPGFEEGYDEQGYILSWGYDAWDLSTETSVYHLDPDAQRGTVVCIENLWDNDARVEQQIAVRGNSLYKFSGYLKAEGFSEDGTGANLSVKDCFASSPSFTDTNGQWVYTEFYGRTSWLQKSLTFCARAGGYGSVNSGAAWFDDLKVERVTALPEGVQAQSLKKVEAAVVEEEGGRANWTASFIFLCAAFACAAYVCVRRANEWPVQEDALRRKLLFGLLLAFLLRALLAVLSPGYDVDMGCFRGWALTMAETGPMGFYDAVFCDYPPGYLYVLWLVGALARLLQLPYDSELFVLLLKLPALLADIAAAYLIYVLAQEWTGKKTAAASALVYAVLPAVWLDSALWGQMDAVLVLLILLVLHFMLRRQMLKSALVFAVAVLVKPQALMFGTILLCGFVSDMLEDWKKGLKALLISMVSALALVLLLVTPFSIGRGFAWLIDKYLEVLSSYPYASVNAMNLFGLLGGNWVEQSETVLGLSYSLWGALGMGLSVAYALFLYFRARERRAVLPMVCCELLGVFALGVRMHERYMFPVLALCLLAALAYDDRRLLLAFAGLSVTNGANIFTVLQNGHVLAENRTMQVIVGILNLALLALLLIASYRAAVQKKTLPLAREKGKLRIQVLGPALPDARQAGEKPRFTRADVLLMAALTLVYALTAFYKLGNTYAPSTMWVGEQGQSVVLDLGQEREIGRFYYYGEINDATLCLRFSRDGQTYSEEYVLQSGTYDMFRWNVREMDETARYAQISISAGPMRIYELALTDAQGTPYDLTVPEDAQALADEQWMVPARPGYMDGMYFDESYHGRTAYEQLNNRVWYENTHPPLGKVFISWSIALLGMTPFGWRFAGTLAGVLMVPALYYLAKLLFKKSGFAFASVFLFCFDFMHLAQTRLGTIDSYPVLFIILEFACMLHYAHLSFYHEKLIKTLVPLFFSGLFMGLGIASKWIGVYAGAGLAVFFFAILFARFGEYRKARQALAKGGKDIAWAQSIVEKFPTYTLATLLCCLVFFVAVPIAVYIGSYYQFLRIEGNGLQEVWAYQQHMLNYHKGVFQSHPFASPWYQWPLILKPIWYYLGEFEPEGMVSSIASLGNPALWWPGLLAILWLCVRAVQGYGKTDRRIYIVLLGYFMNFLPWVLVPRITFIYHYFASVPFLALAVGLYLEDFYARHKYAKTWIGLYLAVVLALYALFYPLLTGIPMPDVRAQLFEWLPSWHLF